MYLKNDSSPKPIYAIIVNASDGSPITSGVAAYHIQGTTRTPGQGTLTHIANGRWAYVPTQAETNYDAFAIDFYHADAVGKGALVEVVTANQGLAIITADTSVIKQKTDAYLDATISSRAPANTALSNTVWTDAKAAYLDAAISSRLEASSYVAPDNASIASIKSKTDAYLDAAVSSRLAASAYTPPDNASISSIKNTVDTKLDATISSRAPANTALSNTVWTDAKADFLDAAISSRLAASDYTPPDNASIASIKNTVDSKLDVNVASRAPASTALSNEIWTNAKAAYLDAAISSRLDASSYVAPDNTSISAIKTQTDKFQFDSNNYVYAVGIGGESGTDWTDTEKQQIRYRLGIDGATQAPSTNSPHLGSSYSTLDDLAAHVSTRLAASAYTPPDNASITAIKTKTDQLSFDSGKVAAKISDPVSVSSSDISAIVDGVWDELISQHTTTGSAGAVLAAASDDGTSPGTIVCSPVIYPLQLSTAPRTSGPSITWYTGEKPAASFVIKSTDLTTKDVVLSVFALANPQEVLLEAAGSVAYSEATLTSTVNISLDELALAPSFAYRYILKNVTDDTVLASGPLYVISVPA